MIRDRDGVFLEIMTEDFGFILLSDRNRVFFFSTKFVETAIGVNDYGYLYM
jgi:hypothetical protein